MLLGTHQCMSEAFCVMFVSRNFRLLNGVDSI